MPAPTTPFSTADLPKEGSVGRKVYDLLAATSEGLALFELEAQMPGSRAVAMRLDELASKGAVYMEGKKEGEPGVMVDVWKARRPEAPKPKPGVVHPQKLDPHECPACGETVHMLLPEQEYGGGCVLVNPRKRLVIFDGPYEEVEYQDPDTGETKKDQLPVEPLIVFEEWTGRLVIGRAANDEEREAFGKKKLQKPWTIGYEGHLKDCTGGKNWMSGAAERKYREMDQEWDRKEGRFAFVKRKPKTFSKKAKGDAHEKHDDGDS